jgi:hypothetical protein
VHCALPENENIPSRVVFPSIIAVNGPDNVVNEILLIFNNKLDQKALSTKTKTQSFFCLNQTNCTILCKKISPHLKLYLTAPIFQF